MNMKGKLEEEQREIALFMAKAAEQLGFHQILKGDSQIAKRSSKTV